MKHMNLAFASLVTVAFVAAMSLTEPAQAENRHQASMEEMTRSYCENAIRTARLNMPTDELRPWKLVQIWYLPDRHDWEQYQCSVDAQCRRKYHRKSCRDIGQGKQHCSFFEYAPPTWHHTTFSGPVDQVQRLTCQDGWLKPK